MPKEQRTSTMVSVCRSILVYLLLNRVRNAFYSVLEKIVPQTTFVSLPLLFLMLVKRIGSGLQVL